MDTATILFGACECRITSFIHHPLACRPLITLLGSDRSGHERVTEAGKSERARERPQMGRRDGRGGAAASNSGRRGDVRQSGMKPPLTLVLPIGLAACAGGNVPLNTDFSPPISTEIARSFALRDRYDAPKHIGATAIFVDSVAVHHIYAEASTIVCKDDEGKWQWSQVSEIGPGGLLPVERKLDSNKSRSLTESEAQNLDRLIADARLYSEKAQTTEPRGIGAPGHVMSIVTPFGRKTITWDGRLEGVGGAIADIVLGKD